VYAKFRCAPLRIKKAFGIFRELITTTRRTRVAFWDPPSGVLGYNLCSEKKSYGRLNPKIPAYAFGFNAQPQISSETPT